MTTRKLPAIAASLALLALVTAMFFPALFGGKILAPLDITTRMLAPWNESAHGAKAHNHNPTDAVIQYLPYRIHAAQSLREDGYIGWNPYEMGGYSLAGNTMALPGTWTLQLHRFLPFKDAWNFGVFAEFLIAGSGMLVFLRGRKLPWLPCLIGAAAFMFNSQFIIWIYHRWALSSFCWMPWVLWSATDGFSLRSPTVRQLLLPAFLALALLGGSLQHMVFVGLACGCLLAGGIANLKSPQKDWPLAVGWSFSFLIALGIAAFSIIPQVQGYLTNIQIGHTRGGISYPEGSTQPFFNLFVIPAQIWPWLLGDPQSIDAWKLLKSGFMNLAYLGTIPMLLGIAGLFFKNMPRQAKWLVAAGLLIPLTPLVGPLYHRVQLLFLLGGAWMAAEMIARLSTNPPSRLIKWWSRAVIALGVFLLAGSCLPAKIRTTVENQVVSKSLQAAKNSQFGDDPAWIEARARRWVDRFALHNPRTAWTYGLLVLGTLGLSLSSNSRPARAKWGNVAILGATSLELFTLFQVWTTYSDPDDLLPKHPAIEQIRELAGSQRVYQGFGRSSLGNSFAAPNLLSAYSIPVVDAYESIQYRSTSVVLRDTDPAERLTLAGVGISIQPTATPPYEGTSGWPMVKSIHGIVIRQNPQALAPLLSGKGPLPRNKEEVLPRLNEALRFSPSQTSMNHWSFDWPADADWVRISQNWHPGWYWRSGNLPWKPILQGPDSACWIDSLPATNRHIEVQFLPRPQWLAFASIATALAWLGLATVGLRRRALPR